MPGNFFRMRKMLIFLFLYRESCGLKNMNFHETSNMLGWQMEWQRPESKLVSDIVDCPSPCICVRSPEKYFSGNPFFLLLVITSLRSISQFNITIQLHDCIKISKYLYLTTPLSTLQMINIWICIIYNISYSNMIYKF